MATIQHTGFIRAGVNLLDLAAILWCSFPSLLQFMARGQTIKSPYEQTEVLGVQDTVGAFVGFEFTEELIVKVATSFTGFDGALANLNAEIPGWDINVGAGEIKSCLGKITE
jgi:putative alpha-1,2-mannosidase